MEIIKFNMNNNLEFYLKFINQEISKSSKLFYLLSFLLIKIHKNTSLIALDLLECSMFSWFLITSFISILGNHLGTISL